MFNQCCNGLDTAWMLGFVLVCAAQASTGSAPCVRSSDVA
jgi:hypothetical protein